MNTRPRRFWSACVLLAGSTLLRGGSLPAQLAAPPERTLAGALRRVEAEHLEKTVEFLAADELQGRCAGEEGCAKAAELLVRRFDELGLAPGGDDGTFLQHFEIPDRRGGRVETANVVAFWEGSDPVLKDEVVVLGAHYDHVGTASSPDVGRLGGGADEIWNGADDNASGTSALVEIAAAFAGAGLRAPRSLLFLAFGAEEHGLLGSLYYCNHPFVPLERTVAMINLDMIGRNPDRPVEVLGLGSLKNRLWYRFVDAAHAAAPELELELKTHSLPDSDHYPFQQRGVPIAFFFTGLHEQYHRPGDHADLLSYERMVQITWLTLALLFEVASAEEPLEFEAPRFEGRSRKSLGVSGHALSAAEREAHGIPGGLGGYVVEEVLLDSTAAEAGILPGDVLLAVRGKELSATDPETSLRRAVIAAPRGEDVEIRLWREGEVRTLPARW